MKTNHKTTVAERERVTHTDPLENAVRAMLRELGEDPEREGLLKTPHRVAESLRVLTSGDQKEVREVRNGAVYCVAYVEMADGKDSEIFRMA